VRVLLLAALLLSGAASAQIFPGGGGGGGAVTPTDVQAALVGQAISASSYTATTATSPGFQCSQDLEACIRLGTGLRATIGTCNGGAICIGPNSGSDTGLYLSGFFVARSAQFTSEVDLLGDNAYLRNNSGPLRINDTDGLVINATTPLKGRVAVAVTFDSAAISNNACNPQAVTVTGAVVNDFVSVNADFALPAGVGIQGARVTAADTVELNLCNNTTGGALDPASGSYLFKLER
jgi:hypothetical protein